uniref:Uncharacterized protein n=1 Tax=Rhizophora mucronata TaxID=61149 RepID=A0A2P2Q1M1_RHIMU
MFVSMLVHVIKGHVNNISFILAILYRG